MEKKLRDKTAEPVAESLHGTPKDSVKSDGAGKHTAKSLRGFLQYGGKPLSTEELCQPVEYPDYFNRSE